VEIEGTHEGHAPGMGGSRRTGICGFCAGARAGVGGSERFGWVGKNSLLLNQGMGSYFFIAEIIMDVELEPDAPTSDHCGTCTRCIDACPTGAIIQSQVVDGSKCISYYTIELRGAIPEPAAQQLSPWVFGCDICQEVCPWNQPCQATQ
jgi:epoxyqueuosine reductase